MKGDLNIKLLLSSPAPFQDDETDDDYENFKSSLRSEIASSAASDAPDHAPARNRRGTTSSRDLVLR